MNKTDNIEYSGAIPQPEAEEQGLYESEGQLTGAVGAVIMLIVGSVVAVLVLIFGGALGGQTYNLVEPDINNINDSTIKASVKAGITSGFEALEQTGDYLPIVILAVIISLVMGLVLSFTNIGAAVGGGSVL